MNEPTIAAKSPNVLELEPGAYYWCACGKSTNGTFCEGLHTGTGFSPLKFEIAEKQQVALCRCKHTHNPPFCDGTHKTLAND